MTRGPMSCVVDTSLLVANGVNLRLGVAADFRRAEQTHDAALVKGQLDAVFRAVLQDVG